ncbi:MAG: radical SAM protein [Candidatus Omnitrophica bacterium]|nr:radical SAM protein [Candidatus Omnitrophota bacterium]MBU3934032.1 radical SAM protein [Candidatus Omnitrophota bacterium]
MTAETDLKKDYFYLKERIGFCLGRLFSCPVVAPEHVYFSLTSRCNLRCAMCDISKNPSSAADELSTAKVKDIILQIKKMGIRHIIFSGGEPLLREDLIEVVQFAISIGIEMADIITNGTLFNDRLIEKLIKIRTNHITFSLDGLKDTNDYIRERGVFEKSEDNIDKFNYYKNKYSAPFPTIGINFTIMNRNINDILPMIEFARNKKCNIVLFQPILFNNTKMYEKKRNILWLAQKDIVRLGSILSKVVDLKENLRDICICTSRDVLRAIPYYFQGERLPTAFGCYEAIKRIVISSDGKLWSCMGIYGDLNKNDLQRCWFSKEAMKVRWKTRKCKEHCLQDCTYSPSNILKDLSGLLVKWGRMQIRELKRKGRGCRKGID